MSPPSSITLLIPAALRMHCGGKASLNLQATDVRAALSVAGRDHQDFLRCVLTRDGKLRPFVKIFVREEDVRQLDGLDTALADGDVVAIVPSVAGG